MDMTPTQEVEVLRASCCIAGADGETTDDELQHLKRLATAVGVGEASLNAMMARGESDPEFYKLQFNILKSAPLECLEVLLKVTLANGAVKESEFEVLKGLANQLEISEEEFKSRITAVMENQQN